MDWDVSPHLSYFSGLSLENFKGFKKTGKVPFAPLTFLVGPNSGGKSSLFSSALLLSQSRFIPEVPTEQQPRWEGPLVDLGSFVDTVYRHNPSLSIKIGVELHSPLVGKGLSKGSEFSKSEILFSLRTRKNDPIGYLRQLKITDSLTRESLDYHFSKQSYTVTVFDQSISVKLEREQTQKLPFRLHRQYSQSPRALFEKILGDTTGKYRGKKSALKRLQSASNYFNYLPTIQGAERVSSGRAGPRRWYSVAEMAGPSQRTHIAGGLFSEINPQMLSGPDDYPFHRAYMGKRRRSGISLNKVLSDLDIADSIESSELSPYHKSIDVTDSITGIKSNLIDVGYGASQVIPVIRACMSPSTGPLFVEQPEIHLHPKAQGSISEMLCKTSLDRQIIIETHSVHLINKARILVSQGKLKPEHMIVNFIYRTPQGSQVISLPVDYNGEFTADWPEGYGFFDERYQDTMMLLNLKK